MTTELLHKMIDGVKVFLTPEEEASIRAEWAANDILSQTTKYIQDRVAAYPSIGDQLDLLYHDKVDGTTKWQEAIAAVKLAYPKPQ